MDYGNSIFSWFNIENSKLASFLLFVLVLDANLKIYQGNLSLIQKIAQAITSIVTYILDFIFMEGHSSEQNRLRAAI
jgi:hypothetical protein